MPWPKFRLPRRTAVLWAVTGVAGVLTLGACGGSDAPSMPTSTTAPPSVAVAAGAPAPLAASDAPITAAPAVAPTVAARAAAPTAVDVTTTSTRPPRGLATPEAASKNLWDAWRDDDRPRALVAATPAAVDALFREPWGAEIRNQGCAALSANTYRCAFVAESTARVVTVVGGVRAGYRSTRVDEVPNAALATLVPVTTVPVATPGTAVGGVPVSSDPPTGAGVAVGGATAAVDPAPDGAVSASNAAVATDAAAVASEAPTIPTTAKPRATRSSARRVAKTTRTPRAETTTPPAEAPATTVAPPATTEGRVAVNAPVTQVADG